MKLNEKHRHLIQMLADLEDTRTKEKKSKAAGFAPKRVFMCLRDAEFLAAFDSEVNRELRKHRAQVHRNLLRDSNRGDTQASRTFLQSRLVGDIQGATINAQIANEIHNTEQNLFVSIGQMPDRELERVVAGDDRVLASLGVGTKAGNGVRTGKRAGNGNSGNGNGNGRN